MKNHKNLSRLLCGLLCLCLCLSACKKDAAKKPATDPAAKDIIYTINVKTAGGMLLNNVVAYVYENADEDDLLTYGTLDNNGSFTFTAKESDQYTVRLANLPKEGYDVQPYYPITGAVTNITLTSSVITGKDPLETGVRYELGDVMRDFTVTTVDGEKLTLSEILKEKQAVVLNFWYTDSNSCKVEFPMLQEAYEAYSNQIEVIAMNPVDITRDTVQQMIAFRNDNGLTMPMAACSSQWLSAFGFNSYPTTIVIDRYGVVCLLTGTVEEYGVFESVFAHFAAEPYQQKLVEDVSELHTVEYAVGHPKNPYETYGAVGQFDVTVPAGEEFYILIYKADGAIMHLEDPNAYVIYSGERYTPNGEGVIEVLIENPDAMVGASLIIGNTGVTASTISVEVILPPGDVTNPYDGVLGENNIRVEQGNNQGVYYLYVSPVDGVITLTVTDAPDCQYDIQLYNLYTMSVRNLLEEALVDENGNRYISLNVRAGDEIRVGYMTMPDAEGNHPAMELTAEVIFAEAPAGQNCTYTINMVDNNDNPMENVCAKVDIDGVETLFYSDATGLITMELPSGFYTVKIEVPEGYECAMTHFLLTPENAAVTVVMNPLAPQQVAYTVYVVDENGAPVANAAVVLGGNFYYSDVNGVVSVVLLQSNSYVATVVAPDGYTIATPDYAFGTETSITVVLRRSTATEEKLTYTVKVVDQNGEAFFGVLVRFTADNGTVAATQAVDAKGQVTVNLPKANYSVSIVFTSGNEMGYEPTATKLTPSNTSLTIALVPFVTGDAKQVTVQDEDQMAYIVGAGSVYVDLTDTAVCFFLFTPEKTGVYSITTTNPEAALNCWDSPFFAVDGTSAVENNVYTFEVNEVGGTVVLSVSGGEGIVGTVLKITRVGDSTSNSEYVTYKGTTVPTAPFVVEETGKKTYLDLAAENALVKGRDGYYHWGSPDGRVVYMDLMNARYGISIADLVDVTSMHKYEYDHNGRLVKRIDYTECMIGYVDNADKKHGVYALTDDLITIIQSHGESAGWYDTTSQTYLFGSDTVLEENAWMFLLCIFK